MRITRPKEFNLEILADRPSSLIQVVNALPISGAASFVSRFETISMPAMRPLPRTSPVHPYSSFN